MYKRCVINIVVTVMLSGCVSTNSVDSPAAQTSSVISTVELPDIPSNAPTQLPLATNTPIPLPTTTSPNTPTSIPPTVDPIATFIPPLSTPVIRSLANWEKSIVFVGEDGLVIFRPDNGTTQLAYRPEDTASSGNYHGIVGSSTSPFIAFTVDALLVANLNTGVTQMIYKGNADAPKWSPSGIEMAFIGRGGLQVANLETGIVRLVADDVWGDYAWTADGRSILYLSDPDHDNKGDGISIVSVDGSAKPQLVSTVDAVQFSVAPIAGRFVFQLANGEIWMGDTSCLRADEPINNCKDLRQLAATDSQASYLNRLRLSPDGKYLVGLIGLGGIRLIDTSSGEPIQIDPGGPVLYDTDPWSVNSQQLLLPIVYDGGMTNSQITIYDVYKQESIWTSDFQGFSKYRIASWGPFQP